MYDPLNPPLNWRGNERAQNKAIVERYMKVTLSGNLDELKDVVHKNVKGADGEDAVRGIAAVRAYFEGGWVWRGCGSRHKS